MVKTIKIIIIALILVFTLISTTYAFDPSNYEPVPPTQDSYNDFFGKAGTILGFLQSIGAIVSVLGIAIIGIRFMLGSLEEKAKYKETMLPFIIGIVITVGVTTIITIVKNIAT